MKGLLADLAKLVNGLHCQICYAPVEIIDPAGSWCQRCHKEFTNGLLDPKCRVTLIDMIRKYRKETITINSTGPIMPLPAAEELEIPKPKKVHTK